MEEKEEKEMINEDLNKEETNQGVENYGEAIKAMDEEGGLLNNEESKEDSKFIKFIKKFLAATIDQIINLSISLVLLLIFDGILRLVGLYVAERQPIFLITYIVVSILYTSICESTKLNKTIGKKIILK